MSMTACQARTVGLEVDNDGMRVDLLEGLLRRSSDGSDGCNAGTSSLFRPALVYIIPQHHNPVGRPFERTHIGYSRAQAYGVFSTTDRREHEHG